VRLAGVLTLVPVICMSAVAPVQGSAPVHGAKAAGMNTAFTGLADDPSAILHNPAGITQLDGVQLYAGASMIIPGSTYTSPGGEAVDTRFQAFFPPHFFVTRRLDRGGMTVGVGVYSPFGIGGRKWPADGPTRYASIESAIGTVALNPTLSVELGRRISVAIGFDYMWARNLADNAIDQSAMGAADAHMEIDADGDGWGYNLGVLYRPADAWSIGLAYRSEIRVDQDGTLDLNDIAPAAQPLFGGASFHTTVSGRTDFPDMIDLGIAYRPTDRWVVDIDVERAGWSSFRRAELDLATEVPAAGLTDISIPLDWHNAWAYKVGVDYQFDERLSLRAGYAFLNSPVPEATLSPANPDADQHNLSVGLGWRRGSWTFDGFYNLGLFDKRQVTNAILSGTYDNTVHYIGLSLAHRF